MPSPTTVAEFVELVRKSGVIEDSGVEHDARVSLYRLKPERFGALRDWLDEVEAFWTEELSAFKAHAERTRRKRRP